MDKYILWDNDGVLVDTEYWYFKSTQLALSELGVSLSKSTYLQFMALGRSCWDLVSEAGISLSELESKRADRDLYYQDHLLNQDIEIPGVIETLEKLSKTHRMGIVTTSKRNHFDLIHRNTAIVPFMEFVIAREDYVLSKPSPEPYLLGLGRFGAQAENCIVVEDSQRGLRSAIAAGIDCAVVHNDFTVSHDFSGARYLLDSINELPEVLGESSLGRQRDHEEWRRH